MLTFQEAEQLLKEKIQDEDRITHSYSVSKLANEIALQIKKAHPELNIDSEQIRIAALLHDIGRAFGEPHSITGCDFLKSIGEPELGEMILGHFFIVEDPDNPKYFLKTIGQKIVSYGDMHVLKNGDIASFKERVDSIIKAHGENSDETKVMRRIMPRLKKLIEEIEELK